MNNTKNLVLAVLLLLAGCGQDDDNHGYGFDSDVTASNGVRIRYHDGIEVPSVDLVAQWFTEAVECADLVGPQERAGIFVPPPLVIMVTMGTVDPYDGLIYYDTGTVLIERQWSHDRGLFVHEFEHWILYSRGATFAEYQHTEGETAPEFQCRWMS